MICFAQTVLKRWIILPYRDSTFAWSGSQWVPMDGHVHIANFETEEDAEAYAWGKKFPPIDQLRPA